MNPTRLAVFAMMLLTAATVHAQPVPFPFGTLDLGDIATACGHVSGPANIDSITVATPYFVRGIRIAQAEDKDEVCDNIPGVTTPTTLPRSISADELLVFDVDLVATQPGNDVRRVLSINGQGQFEFFADINTVPGCFPSPTVNCLQDDRFKVRSHWRTNSGTRGAGPVVPVTSDDSGLFYFFNEDNWEILLKVLNGCPINSRFWVFSAATTNVEFTVTVTDTQEQEAVSYFKPQGPPAPAITDTNAFATCP